MVDHIIIYYIYMYFLQQLFAIMATVTGYDLLYCCICGTEIAFEKSFTLPFFLQVLRLRMSQIFHGKIIIFHRKYVVSTKY